MKKCGVIMLFFDLPMGNKEQRKVYRNLIKNLKICGFVFMQESVYVKEVGNIKLKNEEVNKIRSFAPNEGSIYCIFLTLEQFKRMKTITGENFVFDDTKNKEICIIN